jgi:hypothetical protein
MNNPLDMIEALLKEEEEAGPPAQGRADVEEHRERRARITELLEPLTKAVNVANTRFRVLPQLPNIEHVVWAERMLAFPHLALLVIDSTGVQDDSDVIRVVVADGTGALLLDRIVAPGRQRGRANTTYTGITREQVNAAPTLADIWPDLQNVLAGRVTIAYGYDFAMRRLHENARHYHLDRLPLTGDCIMEHAKSYYGSSNSLKLADVCYRVGYQLPQPATAPDRVAAQIAFLQAMSKGVMNVHYVPPKIVEEDGADGEYDDGLDEHPF